MKTKHHKHVSGKTNDAAEPNYLDDNFTFDVKTKHHKHVSGKTNEVEPDSIENFTYDIKTKKGKHISGHTNEASSDLPQLLELATDVDAPASNSEDDIDLDKFLMSLYQSSVASQAGNQSQQLDTNVMFDPATGEGLVCVNGRCISSKKKMQLSEEREMGFRNRRGAGRGGAS